MIPTIPRVMARAALVRATCDGSGLITFRTEDGPEHYACHGCRACTPTSGGPVRAARDPFAGLCDDDEGAF